MMYAPTPYFLKEMQRRKRANDIKAFVVYGLVYVSGILSGVGIGLWVSQL